MTSIELNQKGNFDSWDKTKLAEIKNGKFSEAIGELLYKNDEVSAWKIELQPLQRLPFRRHSGYYRCICLTDGLLVSRNVNGSATLFRFNKAESFIWDCTANEIIFDLENLGEDNVQLSVIEEKFQ